MQVIFLDGESKGGKTAVGRHIKQTLESNGRSVRLIISGNFFRTVTWLVLPKVLSDPTDEELLTAVNEVLQLPELQHDYDEARLQSSDVDALVSRIGSLDEVQTAVVTWRWEAAKKALDDGIDILVFDGRNLRQKMHDWMKARGVKVALELIIFCRAEVAAARYLANEGNKDPSESELANVTRMIEKRRQTDRRRNAAAYQDPVDPVRLAAGIDNAKEAVAAAFTGDIIDPPRPIIFDNSEVPLKDGLATVAELSVDAVGRSEQSGA
jgi:cytidylate kinase